MILGIKDQANNQTIEKYCYNDDPANCTKYGGLYQWAEAMQYKTTEKAPGICPEGWHIPTEAEFTKLKTTVNNSRDALSALGQLSTANNSSGFSALLAGIRYGYGGSFGSLGFTADFWSSTEYIENHAYLMYLYYSDSYVSLRYDLKSYGFSIRCLKD